MKIIAAVAALALTGTVMADSATQTLGIDWDSGTTGEVAVGLISLPDIASLDSIVLNLSHTYCGDFVITLTTPGGAFFLMDGVGGSSDLGVAGTGFLADVAPYEYVESGGAYNWGDNTLNPAGSYNSLEWLAGPIGAGDYVLSITDQYGGDGGAIGDWTINYTIPAPGALALLGLAGLVVRRRR